MPTTLSEQVAFSSQVQGPSAGDPRTSASIRSMGTPIVRRTRWLLARMNELLGTYLPISGTPTAIEACNVTTGVFTVSGHGLSTADPVRFTIGASGGGLPGAITVGTIYYAVVIDSDTFGVSATSGGPQLTSLGGSLSGETYGIAVNDAFASIYAPAAGSIGAGTLRDAIINFVTATDLASQTTSSSGSRLVGVEAITGTSFNFSAATLYTTLKYIADNVPRLGNTLNAFTGAATFGTTLGVTGATSLSSTLNVSGVSTMSAVNVSTDLRLVDGAVITRDGTSVSASATTATIDPSAHCFYRAQAWNGAGRWLAITLASYAGSLSAPEVEFEFNPIYPGSICSFSLPAAPNPSVILTGRGTVRFRWVSGVAECITPPSASLVFCA